MKNLKIIIPIVLIFLVGMVAIVLGLANDDKKELESDNNEVYTTIVLSINPKIALEVDKYKKVVNMYPLNEDAEDFDREAYVGLSLERSIDKVVDDAKEFLSDDNIITISITDKKHVNETEIENIIKTKHEEIEVETVQLSEKEIEDIKELVEDYKEKDKQKPNKTTSTTTIITDESTTTSTSTTTKITAEKKSNNNNLASLSVEGISFNFKTNTLNYEGIVDYSKDKVKINAKTEDKKAKVSGTGTKELKVGDNTLKVTVMAEDKSTKTYKIKITRRPQYNLNDNVTVTYGFSINVSYVYPTKEECIGKNPFSISIPEGSTYDSYCGNKILTKYPEIKGNGYVCNAVKSVEHSLSDSSIGMTASYPYGCDWIREIISGEELEKKINKVTQVGNYYLVGGGLGDANQIILDEEACKKYNITCGRW